MSAPANILIGGWPHLHTYVGEFIVYSATNIQSDKDYELMKKKELIDSLKKKEKKKKKN